MKKRKIWSLLAAFLALCTVTALFSSCSSSEAQSLNPEAISLPEVYYNPLTGESGFNKDAVGKHPVAVMVSNIKESLPQWGITSADIVYEAVTEGGITRLMCLFADSSKIPSVGPVRSVREYYPQFSEPFHAVFVHWGGSTTGYDTLKQDKIDDLDGMTLGGNCFLQDTARLKRVGREHTFYTNSSLIASCIQSKDYGMDFETPRAFNFVAAGTTATMTGDAVTKATIKYSSYTTAVFEYDSASGKYLKSQYGAAHIDANNNEQVKVDNVVVLYAPTAGIADTYLTRYDLTGGTGYYISKGTGEKINWTKGDYNEMFKLTDESGKTIDFNTGKTWVCVVPKDEASETVLEGSSSSSSSK